MKPESLVRYHTRMQRVLAYIDEHLEQDLTVEMLSGVAAFSKHHFHRQFSSFFGIGVYRYIQLLRLKRASYRLAFRDREPVIQIALDSGYEGPEAFARAFKQRTKQTPSAFREEPHWAPWHDIHEQLNRARSLTMQTRFHADQVQIVNFPATPVAILEHRGDPRTIGDSIRRFIAWRKANGVTPRTSKTFNVLHSDPDDTPPDEFRLGLCAATEKVDANDDGIVAGMIPAGRCAVLRLKGSSDDLSPAVSYLYGEWLPKSGEELRDFPVFAERVTFFPDLPEHEAITDLFLPLR
ncbi:AraC family transcriptional regulator [Microvirga flocculans]|uniref:AraC family transcriptional regulator n=1 Tax=Microvirga flocculans TaxID=217168 RepID=A0A7W6N8X0_9HYPH|nr:AraC family transcriptional regulator [Microvirga flocculans]MBB4040848.1 AraC family transcriptional regulator [Microvirga flocculans]